MIFFCFENKPGGFNFVSYSVLNDALTSGVMWGLETHDSSPPGGDNEPAASAISKKKALFSSGSFFFLPCDAPGRPSAE